jgi:hypothetical protein
LANALPEPDLKYRSSFRAVASSVTAIYDLSTAGRNSRRNNVTAPVRSESAAKIVGRADVDVAVSQFKEIYIPHTPTAPNLTVSLRSKEELRETPYALQASGGLPPEARRA